MEDPLLQTWTIHDRINQYLLEAVAPETIAARLNTKSRTVFQLFAHIHNVRLMWIKAAAPELLEGLEKVEGETGKKETLVKALAASGKAIEELLAKAQAAGGKVNNFKPHSTAFIGYLISHESHHRGQIGWTLKYTGHPLEKSRAFGLWEWGVR